MQPLLFLFLDQLILAGDTKESKQITANSPLSLLEIHINSGNISTQTLAVKKGELWRMNIIKN